MYDRKDGDRILTFDFGEGLVEDNLLVVDRETDSVWSQLDGKAIAGPLKGDPMRVVPTLQTSWKHWTTLHPETLVLTVPGSEGRSYHYSEKRGPLGLGVSVGGESLFAPLDNLEAANRWLLGEFSWPIGGDVTLGGKDIFLWIHPEESTAWAEDSEGNLLPGVLAYEPGWFAFHPNSMLYTRKGRLVFPTSEESQEATPQTPRRK